MQQPYRIYLSPPELAGDEEAAVLSAMRSGWIAPLGPDVDAFEAEFAQRVGSPHAIALSSGTAALHLALLGAGLGAGDYVAVSSFTFAASVNPILYTGAIPVLIDSERSSWNMDPGLLEDALIEGERRGRQLRAIVLVHLYGQPADIDAIQSIADRYGVTVIEDAAEALGAAYNGAAPGTFGRAGIFSFNGNKIITTSGGGMLVTRDRLLAEHARKLATQAREPAPHYEHVEVGYNYRLSNLLAAVGRVQLRDLERRVLARRAIFERYAAMLAPLPGFALMPEASWATHSRWLTCITIDPVASGTDRDTVRMLLERHGIESRPLWKPMHLQPVFRDAPRYDAGVSTALFRHGLCLPSGSGLSAADLSEVGDLIRSVIDGPPARQAPA